MAPNDEYSKAFDKAVSDLADRIQKRDLLNAEIAGLRETVRVLSSRVSLTADKKRQVAQLLAMLDYATPNLADSVRSLLARVYPQEMTAIEIRNALEDSGFNFDEFSNALSACHAALKRMLNDGEIEAGKEKNGKQSYKGILAMYGMYGLMPDTMTSGISNLSALAKLMSVDTVDAGKRKSNIAGSLRDLIRDKK